MPPSQIHEGSWDCLFCGTEGNLGSLENCPNCGKRRPLDVVFYLPEDARIVTDPAEIARSQSGPDWQCAHCGGLNANTRTNCQSCGAPKARSTKGKTVEDWRPTNQVVRAGQRRPRKSTAPQMAFRPSHYQSKSSLDSSRSSSSRQSSSQSTAGSVKLILLGLLAVLILAGSGLGIYYGFIKTTDISANVSGFSWQRQIEVEAYGPVQESGWTTPSDAYNISSTSQIHHYDKVYSHTETKTRQVPYSISDQESYSCSRSLGNGYFETTTCYRTVSRTAYRSETYSEQVYKDVPVYQPYYHYTVDKWHYSHTVTAKGSDHQPSWPEVKLEVQQRQGQRHQKYRVYFVAQADQKEYSKEVDLQEWQSLTIGQPVILQVNQQDQVRGYTVVEN